MIANRQIPTLSATWLCLAVLLGAPMAVCSAEKAEPIVPVVGDGSDSTLATLSPEEKAKLESVREERRKARQELLEKLRNASPEEKAALRTKLSEARGKKGEYTPILTDSPQREGVKHSEAKDSKTEQERKALRKELRQQIRQELRENGTISPIKEQLQEQRKSESP